MFAERTEYVRQYTLPFNAIGICLEEDETDPSSTTDLTTGNVREWRQNDIGFLTEYVPTLFRYTRRNLHLAIHFCLELFPGVDLFSGVFQRRCINDAGLAERAREIFEDTNEIRRVLGAEEFALGIVRRFWPDETPAIVAHAMEFGRALDYAEDHATARLRVADLARAMNMSEGYFERRFRSGLGLTPKSYIDKVLISRATALLSDPSTSVKAVAATLDFSSEFNFSRFFKRLIGLSPRTYRRSPLPPGHYAETPLARKRQAGQQGAIQLC